MMPGVDAIFDWLLGEWIFEREVSGLATMTGEAAFVAGGACRAQYRESAAVQMRDGQMLHGSQQYLYVRRPDGFAVYFPAAFGAEVLREAWLFEEVGFAREDDGCLRGSATHLCKADMYVSEYSILRDGTLTIRHAASGPQKAYVIETLYRRRV